MDDESFQPTHLDLLAGIQPLVENFTNSTDELCFGNLPEFGIGERRTIDTLAPIVFGGAAHLGAPPCLCAYGPSYSLDHLDHNALERIIKSESTAS